MMLFVIFTLTLPAITPAFAANDYILKTGVVGAANYNNNLIDAKAGHTYYFTFSSTESISIVAMSFKYWSYGTNNQNYDYNYTNGGFTFQVAHIDFAVYQASASAPVSAANPLIKVWSLKQEIVDVTNQEITINPANYGGKAVPTKSNVIIALAFTPSIDLLVNSTDTTTYTAYENNFEQDAITYLNPSLQSPTSLNGIWNLLKGANSQDIANANNNYIFNPSATVDAFAFDIGVTHDTLGIAVFAFSIVAILVFFYKLGFEIGNFGFGIVTGVMLFVFNIINIIPIWFTLLTGMLLALFITASRAGNNGTESV